MPITIVCPCGKRLRVRDEMKGKPVRCPGCQRLLEAPIHELPASLAAAPRAASKGTERKPTALPRAWLINEPLTGNIVVLTRDALFTATLADEYRRPVAKAVEEGADPQQLLGDSFNCVLLNDLTEVQIDPNTGVGAYVSLQYRHGGRVKSLMVFCGKEVRDELFAALKERLGRGWRQEKKQRSRWTVLGCSMIALSILLTVTLVCLVLHQLALDPASNPTLRPTVGWIGIGTGILSAFGIVLSILELINPTLHVTLRPKAERVPSPRPAAGGGTTGWSRSTWYILVIVAAVVVQWILVWCGIIIPSWLRWTVSGLMLVGLIWVLLTDRTNTVQEEEAPSDEDAGEAPPIPQAPARRVVVLPEGCEPAELELRCAGCQKSGLMLMPVNHISRQRNFVCPHCGTLMRQAWRKFLFVATAVFGGLWILVGLLLLYALQQGPNANSDVHEKGAIGIAVMGAVVGMWAVTQLRLSPPLGAVPKPRTIWPLLLGAALLGLLLLLVGGAYFVLMFLIDKAFLL